MNVRPLLLLLVALPLHAVELVKWERIPLPVALNIGQERIVFVDRNVRVGYPAALEGKLRIQSSNGTLYLLASQPFTATRLQLQDTENGELILLDVSASKGEHIREPMRIVREEKKTTDAKPDAAPGPSPSTPLPVALTRYAAQMLYAPLRTVEPLPGVQPEGVRLAKTITTLLPALPASALCSISPTCCRCLAARAAPGIRASSTLTVAAGCCAGTRLTARTAPRTATCCCSARPARANPPP
ncbi:TIGR03749 family integrating conjugative element protein [Edwardsiella tarda]|uniref:TIGR03749 family integrating conjugative element protein n=1 Tax=Edwardsiella tarda TaxID=636 RepID=UPI0020A432B1|nr:TIGR03749 family integrating conjugative element protein [Edwardsiella tarda]